MAAEGDAIVLLSSDTPELAHLCDHIMALHNGGFAEILTHAKTTEETIVTIACADAIGRSIDMSVGAGTTPLLGDPAAPQRGAWRLVHRARGLLRAGTPDCFPASSPLAR
jgi:hypothetical protein